MTAPHDYVALSRRWFDEVWNHGKLDTVHELAAPNVVGYGQGPQPIRSTSGLSPARRVRS